MVKKSNNQLISSYFIGITDFRKGNAIKHNLCDIIMIALLGTLNGCKNFTQIADYAEFNLSFLQELMELPNGAPSHDTFCDVFRHLKPSSFEPIFQRIIDDFQEHLGSLDVISIDGKTLRGSWNKVKKTNPIGLVTAWAQGLELSLGCVSGGKGGEEISALRELVKMLNIKNKIITADALHCHLATAETIIEGGGDYCLALKGNQSNLKDDIVLYCNDYDVQALDSCETIEKSHGRIETRHCRVIEICDYIKETHQWKGLNYVAEVKATREIDLKKSTETRYYLLSKYLDATNALKIIRGHWGIENSLHWVLDVTMHEDNHRARKDYSAINSGILRRLALNLLKKDTSKLANTRKITKATYNKNYLFQLLFGKFS